ncbi:hypothetical protein GOODEAATRI_032748, partial [Goodea atripinnis]
YDTIYWARFGNLFNHSFVIAFRVSRTIIRMNATEAEVGLKFRKTAPTEKVPKSEGVQETLVEAINRNTTFNVTFILESIHVIRTPETDSTTVTCTEHSTVAITANLTLPTTFTVHPSPHTTDSFPVPMRTVPPSTTKTSTVTSATNTDTPTPPHTSRPTFCPPSRVCKCRLISVSCGKTLRSSLLKQQDLTTRVVSFTSAKEPFTSDFLNSSSVDFANQSLLIKEQLKPFFEKRFSYAFSSLEVATIRKSLVIYIINLKFESTSVPDDSEIQDVLIEASSSVVDFSIDTESINIQGKS